MPFTNHPSTTPWPHMASICRLGGGRGNDFARDFLSGIAALYSSPMYSNIGKKYSVEWASTILAVLALLVTVPVVYFLRMARDSGGRASSQRGSRGGD